MDQREGQRRAAQIETLIQEVAAFPDPQLRAKTEELLRDLLDLYGTGLTRILEMTAQADVSGQALIETFAKDDLVGSLLLLHGLHPIALETRLLQAIDKIRTSKQARGTTIELVRLVDGVAHLRLIGGSHGCGSSSGGFKQSIEETIYSAAPDLEELRIEEASAPVPLKYTLRVGAKRTRPLLNSQQGDNPTQAAIQATLQR